LNFLLRLQSDANRCLMKGLARAHGSTSKETQMAAFDARKGLSSIFRCMSPLGCLSILTVWLLASTRGSKPSKQGGSCNSFMILTYKTSTCISFIFFGHRVRPNSVWKGMRRHRAWISLAWIIGGYRGSWLPYLLRGTTHFLILSSTEKKRIVSERVQMLKSDRFIPE
jgi:hypothetical protein